MFSACTTYEKQLRIEKTRLSHLVRSHGGSTFFKKKDIKRPFSRPAETDPYALKLKLFLTVHWYGAGFCEECHSFDIDLARNLVFFLLKTHFKSICSLGFPLSVYVFICPLILIGAFQE